MIEYHIEPTERLIRVRMSGDNSCADLERHFGTVLKDPQYRPAFNTLFEVTGDPGGPILTELRDVGTVLELLAQLQTNRKWAVVMPPGFKRTVVEFLLRGVRLGSVQMQFFNDEPEALRWLN